MEKNKQSFQIKADDFLPAGEDEKKSLVVMRESVGFWKDGMRRFKKNKIAMVSLIVVILIFILSFIVPQFYPYKYEQQIKGSNSLAPFEYSQAEQEAIANGEKVFPHILGTDQLGRDYAIRVMMGSRVSLTVGLVASAIILLIGSLYGSIAGFFGGWVDMVMMRIVDIIYTVPDVLIVILLAAVLNYPLKELAMKPGFEWIGLIGVNLISIFVVFALLYWVGMARIVRSQIMILKEQEYVTAARALGASSGSIIKKHLLTNCIGTLIVTTTLQIPSSIFTESFLSFLGLGVNAPMPSQLGRDYAIRVMMGSRVSLTVGLVASAIILLIGSLYGSIAGFFGGWVDMVMMRIVDIIYTVPDVLIVILLAAVLNYPLKELAMKPGFEWIGLIGVNLISIFVVFALLYWVGMARIVRSQIMILKEQEYVTAARALGASSGSIIKKHLLTNCIGTLIVTTTLQIPSSIFTESFLSFLGLGVNAPMPSLGSLASAALNGLQSYPYRLFAPALMISIIILSFNLLGDGLRDAFDPKLKN